VKIKLYQLFFSFLTAVLFSQTICHTVTSNLFATIHKTARKISAKCSSSACLFAQGHRTLSLGYQVKSPPPYCLNSFSHLACNLFGNSKK